MSSEEKAKFLKSIISGIRDGLPVVAQVKQALKDRETIAGPRLITSLVTLAAVVLVLVKAATGALTWTEALEALQRLIPAL